MKLNGWAIESRLYAEDPYRNFLPSIGRLTRYRPPAEGTHDDGAVVRNDTGVFEGGEISMFYDPMIAKLCTWAPDRADGDRGDGDGARRVRGRGHRPQPAVPVGGDGPSALPLSGDITTAFIAEEYPDGFTGVTPAEADARKLAAVAALHQPVRRAPRARGFPARWPTTSAAWAPTGW